MRVLVCSDRIGRLGPAGASNALAAAFASRGAQVAVAPPGLGGEDFADAASRFAPGKKIHRPQDGKQPLRVVDADFLDLTGIDGPPLAELMTWPITDLTGIHAVVDPSQAALPLTGLTGVIAVAARDQDWELAATLKANRQAEQWLAQLGIVDQPGAGAYGGLGAWALAGGATILSPLTACQQGYDLPRLARQADLILTATHELDFHRRGGPVLHWLAELAQQALIPLVVVTGRNFISSRELRLAGIEEAHALHSPGAEEFTVDEQQLRALADRVAASWMW